MLRTFVHAHQIAKGDVIVYWGATLTTDPEPDQFGGYTAKATAADGITPVSMTFATDRMHLVDRA